MAKHSKNTTPRRDVDFVFAKGVWFTDSHDRRYLDLSSQTMNTLLGQGHPEIKTAVTHALDVATFSDQDFASPLHDLARDKLASLLPPHLTVLNLRLNDGSSAVECAVKQARRARGRGRILTFKGIYLGQNNLSIHMRGLGDRPMDLLKGGSEDVIFAPLPEPNYDLDFAMAEAENGMDACRMIEDNAHDLACVVLDPVMISSGVFAGRGMNVLANRVAETCQKYRVPLILDECQTFGWVPEHTLANLWGIPADMMALGKGLAGGLPLAACVSRAEFDNLDFGDADYTNGGNNISVAAALATFNLISRAEEQARFNALCDLMSFALSERVSQSRGQSRTRGVGLIHCIEVLPSHGDPVAFCQALGRLLQQRGIYVRTYGSCLGLKPPRVIDSDTLLFGMDEIFKAIEDLAEGRASVAIETARPDFSKNAA